MLLLRVLTYVKQLLKYVEFVFSLFQFVHVRCHPLRFEILARIWERDRNGSSPLLSPIWNRIRQGWGHEENYFKLGQISLPLSLSRSDIDNNYIAINTSCELMLDCMSNKGDHSIPSSLAPGGFCAIFRARAGRDFKSKVESEYFFRIHYRWARQPNSWSHSCDCLQV